MRNRRRRRRSGSTVTWFGLAAATLIVLLILGSTSRGKDVIDDMRFDPMRTSRLDDLQMLTPLQATTLQLDENVLAQVPSPLFQAASAVLQELPKLQAQTRSSFEVSGGMSVDIILQRHEYVGMSTADSLAARRSQRRVFRVLSALKPELLASEGYSVDSVSVDALTDEAFAYAKANHANVSRETIRLATLEMFRESGDLAYLQAHPGMLVIGSENAAVNELHNNVPVLLDLDPSNAVLHNLNMRASVSRSMIALSRLLHALHERGRSNGAILIGVAHGRDIASICEALSIPYRVFDTTR